MFPAGNELCERMAIGRAVYSGTPNSIRTIPIPKQAVDLLLEEHQKHPSSPYMFPSPKTGKMYDPDAFRRIHGKILKSAGIEHMRFYDLRHIFATLSLQSGMDVKTLSGALKAISWPFSVISRLQNRASRRTSCRCFPMVGRLHSHFSR